MKVWTIQHIDVWNKIQKKGKYVCDQRFICFRDFQASYEWMISIAKKNIPEWTQERGIWFWTKRPDLRQHRHISVDHKPFKQEHVLIELEVDPRELLITDFSLWHLVLNQHYVPLSELDYDRFYELMPKKHHYKNIKDVPVKYRNKILKSWERIVVGPDHKDTTQAIKECIKKEEVVSVKKFWMKNLRKKPKA